ncbi:tubulin-tyrosine ligase family-domain-containing protein [Chytriomyces sp. MP71]|nr:tubulin-tyrosine ligase family-domain-containing protein [Chytriomyces sp. MP71]
MGDNPERTLQVIGATDITPTPPTAPEVPSVSQIDGSRTTMPLKRQKSKKRKLNINTTLCKYDIIRKCSAAHGLRVVDDGEPWSVFWIDTGVSVQRVLEMEPYQKINHFPGMHEICRKDHLARNLARLSRALPKEYNFFPKTYVLPHDWAELKLVLKSKGKQTYIAKPGHGCQGKGIFLFRSSKAISPHKDTRIIVQTYLNKPCLIDGFKFDLRIYVLVTSIHPLRIFVHRDGLARFATEPYVDPTENNMDDVCMHLTNYAINKHSSNFDYTEAEDQGSKRTIESVFRRLMARGLMKEPEELWKRINDAIVKTLLTVQPQVSNILQACSRGVKVKDGASKCFEILGFDIFLDKKLKPWVLEVNHSPSFTCDSPLDSQVKSKVIGDTLELLNLNPAVRRKFEKVERERVKSRLFGGITDERIKAGVTSQAASSLQGSRHQLHSAPSRGSQSSTAASPPPVISKSSSISTMMLSPRPSTSKPAASNSESSDQELLAEYAASTSPALLDALSIYEDAHLGSFRRIFPPQNLDLTPPRLLVRYLRCLAAARRLSPSTVAAQGRAVQLRRERDAKEEQARRLEMWRSRGEAVRSRVMEWRQEAPRGRERMEFPPDEYCYNVEECMRGGVKGNSHGLLGRALMESRKVLEDSVLPGKAAPQPVLSRKNIEIVHKWLAQEGPTSRVSPGQLSERLARQKKPSIQTLSLEHLSASAGKESLSPDFESLSTRVPGSRPGAFKGLRPRSSFKRNGTPTIGEMELMRMQGALGLKMEGFTGIDGASSGTKGR